MREEIANLVFPVLRDGLYLKERLERGEKPDFQAEQTRLRSLLRREVESRQWPAFGGDGDGFLGIRYALACWLDELFCDDQWGDWGRFWNNSKMETGLYKTNLRNRLFWQQAEMAERRSEKDALEGYYLCVMLGFRGQRAGAARELHDWRENIERQLNQGQASAWPGPAELAPPPPNVPPFRGRDRLRWLVFAAVGTLGVAILALAYFTVSKLT